MFDDMVPPPSPHHSADNSCLLKHFGEQTCLVSYALPAKVNAQKVLKNKIVLLYFSASFCGPCRQFTPILEEIHRRLRSRQQQEEFEIVFCSGDTMPVPYECYASKMPWWCLPFQSDVVQRLSLAYNVRGFPHLVVIDSNGSVIQQDAVQQVMADPNGLHFPWRPRSLKDVLPVSVVRADESHVPTSVLDDKYLLVFAGGAWCDPCRRFVPLLAEVYRLLKAQRDDFELLYLSSDRDPIAFQECLSQLGCCAVPYEERRAAEEISTIFNIRCIPNLLMFGPKPDNPHHDRPLLNANVRDLFWQCPKPEALVDEFPFLPTTCGDLNQISDNLNEIKCIVVFCEACDDDEQDEIQLLLQYASKMYDNCNPVRFYWACQPTTLTKTLRESLRLGYPTPRAAQMVLLDLSSDTSYYVYPTRDISAEAVLQFIEQPGVVRKLR